jgi:hypothetical protein
MAKISYRRHRFPPEIIQHAVWLYLRFTLSYRDVEELLAERGLDISYETIRCWVLKFGPEIARRLRNHRLRPSTRWRLDEMVVRIAGRRMYLWRAVDQEGEIEGSESLFKGWHVPMRMVARVQPVALLNQSLIDRAALGRQAVADTIGKAGEFLGEESERRVVWLHPGSDRHA